MSRRHAPNVTRLWLRRPYCHDRPLATCRETTRLHVYIYTDDVVHRAVHCEYITCPVHLWFLPLYGVWSRCKFKYIIRCYIWIWWIAVVVKVEITNSVVVRMCITIDSWTLWRHTDVTLWFCTFDVVVIVARGTQTRDLGVNWTITDIFLLFMSVYRCFQHFQLLSWTYPFVRAYVRLSVYLYIYGCYVRLHGYYVCLHGCYGYSIVLVFCMRIGDYVCLTLYMNGVCGLYCTVFGIS